MIEEEGLLQVKAEHADGCGRVDHKGVEVLLEPVREALLKSRGVTLEGLEVIRGVRGLVYKKVVEFLGRLEAGKTYEVLTRLELDVTTMTFEQEIAWRGQVKIRFTLVIEVVDRRGKRTPIPMEIREKLLK